MTRRAGMRLGARRLALRALLPTVAMLASVHCRHHSDGSMRSVGGDEATAPQDPSGGAEPASRLRIPDELRRPQTSSWDSFDASIALEYARVPPTIMGIIWAGGGSECDGIRYWFQRERQSIDLFYRTSNTLHVVHTAHGTSAYPPGRPFRVGEDGLRGCGHVVEVSVAPNQSTRIPLMEVTDLRVLDGSERFAPQLVDLVDELHDLAAADAESYDTALVDLVQAEKTRVGAGLTFAALRRSERREKPTWITPTGEVEVTVTYAAGTTGIRTEPPGASLSEAHVEHKINIVAKFSLRYRSDHHGVLTMRVVFPPRVTAQASTTHYG